MIDTVLTKYQARLVRELVCPSCRQELVDLGKSRAHCFHCNIHYFMEVISDGHDA